MKKELVKNCRMLDLWILCMSVGRSYFWSIETFIGMLLPFFPWNTEWAQNAHSKLTSLSVAMIIKKMLKATLECTKKFMLERTGGLSDSSAPPTCRQLNMMTCSVVLPVFSKGRQIKASSSLKVPSLWASATSNHLRTVGVYTLTFIAVFCTGQHDYFSHNRGIQRK